MAEKLPAKRAPVKKASSGGSKKYAATRPAVKKTTIVNEKKVVKKQGGSPVTAAKTAAKVQGKQKAKLGAVPKVVTGSFNNKFAPRQRPSKSVITYRHIIAAEFWIGLIIILSTNQGGEIVEAAAYIMVMAILFAVSAGGRTAGRIASALGGLILLTLLMKNTGKTSDRFKGIQVEEPPKHPVKSPNPPGGGRHPIEG